MLVSDIQQNDSVTHIHSYTQTHIYAVCSFSDSFPL